MEILNRSNAPFGAGVWAEIESSLEEFLSKRLTLRGAVDFKDGYGYEADAITTRKTKKLSSKNGLTLTLREPLSFVEIKQNFTVSKATIEDIKRGVEDYDDSELTQAANTFAQVENAMVLDGIKSAHIEGIVSNKEVKKVSVASTKELLKAVAKSLGTFNKEFVEGEYKLVLSSNTMASLHTEFFDGISLKNKLDEILGSGNIVVNEDIGDDKAMILSQRGGDFEFYSGLDVSLGFEKEQKESVELFLLETCAFRVLGDEAAIILEFS